MKREIISLEKASVILEPHYSNLVDCIYGGFEDYLKIKSFASSFGKSVVYEGRTKGSLIHDHIKSRISDIYGENTLVEARKWNNIFALKIADDIFIRFKKFDQRRHISNYKTEQHIKFMAQSFIEGFPDEPTFIFAGYIPDRAWGTIKGVYIACWNGNEIEWFDEIGKYCIQQLNIFDIPANQEEETRLKVRLKGKQQNKNDNNEKTGTNG